MPTHDPIAAARREAKARTRGGAMTHQQALDAVARETGHSNWAAMLKAAPTPQPADTISSIQEQAESLQRVVLEGHRRVGMRISEWIGERMREAATRALDGKDMRDGPRHAIRPLPFDAQMMAQAMDPDGGPWPSQPKLTVRCPLHDDANGSLVVGGTGYEAGMRCLAGCDLFELQDVLIRRLSEASVAATAFMKANDRAKVVAGAGRVQDGLGGRGGRYTLADGSTHELGVLACRMLTEGYPDWTYGDVPSRLYAVETKLRIALAGRHRIRVEQPDDVRGGEWRMDISGYPPTERDPEATGYLVRVQWRKGGPIGVSGAWDHEEKRFANAPDEIYETMDQAVDRVQHLLKSKDTTNPEVIAANNARVAREKAHHEANCGTDKDGWGWWVGSNPDEFHWGGPYKTRAYAIGQGNGHCTEEGEEYYVIQARTVDDEPGEDGFIEFADTRGLKRCRAV